MDYAEKAARQAYYDKPGSPERQNGMDFLWWLWAGRNSPIFGRDRMTTFERRLIKDESAWTEPKNAYYALYQDPAVCDMLLGEFGLEGPHCHIINGHIPVKAKKGESPIKGGGKLIVIDGGFCKAYQPTTGIAGLHPDLQLLRASASSLTSPSQAGRTPSRTTTTSATALMCSSGSAPACASPRRTSAAPCGPSPTTCAACWRPTAPVR